MIDRNAILDQLGALDRERAGLQASLERVAGAELLCRHWLERIDQAEREQATTPAEGAPAEGAEDEGPATLPFPDPGPGNGPQTG